MKYLISDIRLIYEVVPYLAEGLTNAQIGRKINLSADGVKNRVQALLLHLGARNRTHAVAIAYDRGLLIPRRPGPPAGPTTPPAGPRREREPAGGFR